MINTLIVDDSALARDILRDFLEEDGNFKIIGEASDGEEGVRKILALNPDLVTLDLEMPKMNGLEVIDAVMKKVSVPIVVISSNDTAKTAYEATLKGALEFYSKDLFTSNLNPAKRREIYETLKRISGIKSQVNVSAGEAPAIRQLEKRRINAVVMTSSTGGPKALSRFFSLLNHDFPVPIILVQHNSPGFDESFVQWLGTYTALKIKLAEEGEKPRAGCVYIAKTGMHLELRTGIRDLVLRYNDGAEENNQKPSADVLFRTAAQALMHSVISIVLTGMGSDGAAGTRMIREMGGITIAQDEKTSLIYGMPKAASQTGCVDMVLPLEHIPAEITRLTK
ncbi:MAG: chemotaxis protein CheB [Treponema sp.]|nr:chemotaxis protein CheB [Treponema sp.]